MLPGLDIYRSANLKVRRQHRRARKTRAKDLACLSVCDSRREDERPRSGYESGKTFVEAVRAGKVDKADFQAGWEATP